MSTCTPAKRNPTVEEWAALPDCERLRLMEAAAQLLGLGQARSQIRHGDYWVEFHAANLPFLTREIARLRAICHKRTAIVIGRSPC